MGWAEWSEAQLEALFAHPSSSRQNRQSWVVFLSGGQIGYLWRVRLSSFLAGAATASAAGFFLLYKDHLVARAAITRQVEDVKKISEKHYEALNHRISAMENKKESGANKEASD